MPWLKSIADDGIFFIEQRFENPTVGIECRGREWYLPFLRTWRSSLPALMNILRSTNEALQSSCYSHGYLSLFLAASITFGCALSRDNCSHRIDDLTAVSQRDIGSPAEAMMRSHFIESAVFDLLQFMLQALLNRTVHMEVLCKGMEPGIDG